MRKFKDIPISDEVIMKTEYGTLMRGLAEMEINFKQQGYCLNDIFYFDLELIYGEMIK